MFRRFIPLAFSFVLLFSGMLVFDPTLAQQDKQQVTAEGVAEYVIAVSGSRQGLAQIRRNGEERGRLTRYQAEGKTEEATYERRFIRGETADKDSIRIDQKMPTAEYALIYGDGQTWGIINGVVIVPRQDLSQDFQSSIWHSIDALLRYKENGSTISYVGKDKQMGIDIYVLDLTDKEQRRTRYYISYKTGRVLWLEYEESPSAGAAPIKYKRKFYDYHVAQGTLIPYRTVLYENDKLVEETRIMTIVYGLKVDESLFKSPETSTTAAQ